MRKDDMRQLSHTWNFISISPFQHIQVMNKWWHNYLELPITEFQRKSARPQATRTTYTGDSRWA